MSTMLLSIAVAAALAQPCMLPRTAKAHHSHVVSQTNICRVLPEQRKDVLCLRNTDDSWLDPISLSVVTRYELLTWDSGSAIIEKQQEPITAVIWDNPIPYGGSVVYPHKQPPVTSYPHSPPVHVIPPIVTHYPVPELNTGHMGGMLVFLGFSLVAIRGKRT
jgi:hypothetical protein